MTIHLSGQREEVILSLMRAGTFASADEVIDEALRLVGQRYQNPEVANGSAERAAQQSENLRMLGQKQDAMPALAVDDGLSNRDHDLILYGQ